MSRKKFSIQQVEVIRDEIGPITRDSKETKALLQFKQRLGRLVKSHHGDYYLLKWLRARNLDVDKAELMFKNSMAYREKMQVEKLVKNYKPPEVLEKYLPGGFCGFDKEGSPILIQLYGYTDMKGILYSVKKSDIEKTKLLEGETVMKVLAEQSKLLKTHVDGMTVIIDMDNVQANMLWGPGIQMYAHMGSVMQDNYPEIVKRTLIVNAPSIFPILWKMISPLVTEDMKKKVCILGSDYKDELLKHIKADQLPAFLGGTMTDPDGNPRCPSKICQGGDIPEKYYSKELSSTEGMKTVTLAAGGKLEIPQDIEIEGSVLQWEFKTDEYDVGCGLYYEGSEGRETIKAPERVNCHIVAEGDSWTCDKTGKYLIVFDNSFSWARAKTVSYTLTVVVPDTEVVHDLDAVTQGGSWDNVVATKKDTRL